MNRRILTHYLSSLKKEGIILASYSLGVDALPFMAICLPADLLARIRQIVLKGPGKKAEF